MFYYTYLRDLCANMWIFVHDMDTEGDFVLLFEISSLVAADHPNCSLYFSFDFDCTVSNIISTCGGYFWAFRKTIHDAGFVRVHIW